MKEVHIRALYSQERQTNITNLGLYNTIYC